MQDSLLTLTAQVNAQFQSLTSSVDEIQKRLTSMEESMALSSMVSKFKSAIKLHCGMHCITLRRVFFFFLNEIERVEVGQSKENTPAYCVFAYPAS